MDFTSYERRRSIRNKPYYLMTNEEKRWRIRSLWTKVKNYILLKSVIKAVQNDVEEAYIKKMMKNATIVGQGDEEDPNKITLPWYLLRK